MTDAQIKALQLVNENKGHLLVHFIDDDPTQGLSSTITLEEFQKGGYISTYYLVNQVANPFHWNGEYFSVAKALTGNEKALEALMHEAANKPQTRGACAVATINGRNIKAKAHFRADGRIKSIRFAMDGQSAKAHDVWAAVRA